MVLSFRKGLGFTRILVGTLLLQWLVCVSCSPIPKPAEPSPLRLVKGIPFYPQEVGQCGPASLAGVFNYWGVHVGPEEISDQIYSRSAHGTLNLDMVWYARSKGLLASQYRGSLEDIHRNIDRGHPLIVLVEIGPWFYKLYHYMVVVGYDRNGIFVNSGREPMKHVLYEGFLKSWKKTGFWTLRMLPK